MLRLDIVHPIISGNKWYKLKHNLLHASQTGYESIITFGGAYSNHLIAAAAAAKAYNIRSEGIVRGTYAEAELTPTLQACKEYGMQLFFVSRGEYAQKNENGWLDELRMNYPGAYIIPEGGANEYGRIGAGEIANYIPRNFTHVCVSVGTGTTFVGLRNALPANQFLYGYAPMKGGKYLADEVKPHLTKDTNWELFDDWHFGGFGKQNQTLIDSMNEFYDINHIPLDIVYTGKMMYGILKQLKAGVFPHDANLLCIHTGGLQGNSSVTRLLRY